MTVKEHRLMTVSQAAEYLGVTTNTLSTWRSRKRYGIPFIRVGGAIRYRREHLDKWIEQRTSGGGSD